MSDPREHRLLVDEGLGEPAAREGDVEELDGLPVLADPQPPTPAAEPPATELIRRPALALQAAAVAATGFMAGAAMVGLVHRRRQRRALAPRRIKPGGARRASAPMGELVEIVGTRSLLVDVHLLGGRD